MSFAGLLKKGSLRGFATATPATPATDRPNIPPSVATVATVAVAIAPDNAANDLALDLDRWAWPVSTAMNGAEIDTFTARLSGFTDKGVTPTDGEALADKLVTRDRETDDRRLCLECVHLAGHAGSWGCRAWKRAGVAVKARDAGLSSDLVQILQRCDGFKGTAT